jgi:hypothetical protein
METDSQEPVALPSQEEQSFDGRNEPIAWPNIFYGLLIAPATTLKVLANPHMYKADAYAVVGSLTTFCLCAAIESFAQAALEKENPLVLAVGLSFAGDVITWLMLAIFLAVWARCLKCKTNFWSALVVTGWAFEPVIFKAPIVCYHAACHGCGMLLALPAIWFLILELLAFDAVLQLGKARMLAIILVAPPLMIIALVFWYMLWATVQVGVQ